MESVGILFKSNQKVYGAKGMSEQILGTIGQRLSVEVCGMSCSATGGPGGIPVNAAALISI